MEKDEKQTSKRWERKEIFMAVLIGVLVLTAGVQTVQLAGLARAEVIAPAISGAAPSVASSGSAPSVPTNLQNLPSMVGGC